MRHSCLQLVTSVHYLPFDLRDFIRPVTSQLPKLAGECGSGSVFMCQVLLVSIVALFERVACATPVCVVSLSCLYQARVHHSLSQAVAINWAGSSSAVASRFCLCLCCHDFLVVGTNNGGPGLEAKNTIFIKNQEYLC